MLYTEKQLRDNDKALESIYGGLKKEGKTDAECRKAVAILRMFQSMCTVKHQKNEGGTSEDVDKAIVDGLISIVTIQ